jgi:hypothetical protein
MNHQGRATQRQQHQTAYERLGHRMDEIAEREGWTAQAEQTELLGRTMFGDLWDKHAMPEDHSHASPQPTAESSTAERESKP